MSVLICRLKQRLICRTTLVIEFLLAFAPDGRHEYPALQGVPALPGRMAFGAVDQAVGFMKIFIRLQFSGWDLIGQFFCNLSHNVSYSSLS